MKKNISPAIIHLLDGLEHHQIKRKDLANSLAISLPHLNNVLSGNKKLSLELCVRLEKWSGLRASFWWNLECDYRLKVFKKEHASDSFEVVPCLEFTR